MVLYVDTELAMNSTEIPTLAPWFAIQTERTWYEDSSKFPHPSSSGYWCEVNLWDMTTVLPGYVTCQQCDGLNLALTVQIATGQEMWPHFVQLKNRDLW